MERNETETRGEPVFGTCVRCHNAEAPEPDGYCAACVVHTRIEVSTGLRRLAQYLAAWAAFDDWCEQRRFRPEPL